jgi:diacylglycerol O-acyltransferase
VAGIRLMIKSMNADIEVSRTMPPPWEVGARKSRTPMMPVPGVSVDAMSVLRSMLRNGDSLIRPVLREVSGTVRDFRAKHADLVTSFQAPRCILNQKITASRRFAAQSYATSRIKTIARAYGATSNDVLLAMCGGALRSYLMELNALPDRPLVAGVPVSMRRDDGDSGNEFGLALTHLGTHLPDAADRLLAIKSCMDYTKQRMRGMTAAQLITYGALTMLPGVVNMATGIDSKTTLVNVVISHVPGPRQTVYWQGCKLTGLYPVSILIDGIALNITLTSRHDFVDFGLIACRKTLPHMQRLLDYLEQSLKELEQAAA